MAAWDTKEIIMYYFVEDKQFLKRAQSDCSATIKELETLLRNNYDINSQAFLVGSGARNMITQNENEGIDFDYNLNILSCPDWDNAKSIKETVRIAFNKILRNQGLNDAEDSTSSITTKPMYFKNAPEIEFKIDVCIVTKNNAGEWERLIHEKTGYTYNDRYFWNAAPNSKDYQEKARKIKSVPGWWDKVRAKYLDRKNYYLKKGDNNHPSFVCYIEVINDVYNTMRQKKIL